MPCARGRGPRRQEDTSGVFIYRRRCSVSPCRGCDVIEGNIFSVSLNLLSIEHKYECRKNNYSSIAYCALIRTAFVLHYFHANSDSPVLTLFGSNWPVTHTTSKDLQNWSDRWPWIKKSEYNPSCTVVMSNPFHCAFLSHQTCLSSSSVHCAVSLWLYFVISDCYRFGLFNWRNQFEIPFSLTKWLLPKGAQLQFYASVSATRCCQWITKCKR